MDSALPEAAADHPLETRFQSSFILVLACAGVVHFHLAGSGMFYIGSSGSLHLGDLLQSFRSEGLSVTLETMFKGATGIVGLFLVNSGYGLAKSYAGVPAGRFFLRRFLKIYLYGVLCGLLCSLAVFAVCGEPVYGYWSAFVPVFGLCEFPRDGWTAQYWYLSLAFVYYLLFPAVQRWLTPISFWAIVLSCAGHGYVIQYGLCNFTSPYHSTICRFPEFCLGVLLGQSAVLERIVFVPGLWRALAAVGVAGSGYLLFFIPVLSPFSHLIFTAGCYWLLAQTAGWIRSARRLVPLFSLLSEGTYTVYLLHLVVLGWIFHAYKEALPTPPHAAILDAAVIVGLTAMGLVAGCCTARLYAGALRMGITALSRPGQSRVENARPVMGG
jgi:hypothetical protein